MDDIQKVLNQFSEAVGAQIKAVADAINQRIDDQAKAIESISARLDTDPVDYSDQITELQEGIRAMRGEVGKMVTEAVGAIDIKHGVNGRDALDIEILPCIDESKSYARGTYAIHDGGVFRAYQKTVGIKGWECVLNGVADLTASVEGKVMTLSILLSDGTEKSVQHTIPQPEYKGIFKSGESYLQGDSVTYDGSTWIAVADAPDQSPGKGDGWRLAVKRGRDGRGLYAIARDAGYKGTEKELLAHIMKGEIPDSVVRLGGGHD